MAVRTGGPVLVASLVVAALAPTAVALTSATAVGATTASTATWAAVATDATAPPYPTGSYVGSVKQGAPDYFTVVNTGTLPLGSAVYSASPSTTVGLALRACSVAWNTTKGTCSTGAVTVVLDSATNAVPAAVGGRLYVQATATTRSSTTIRIDVSLPRSSARAAGTSSG